ncbi:OsmC family peroxiredoxin [Sesbania bispinosa]|nr:OsmC family peroxiredoxin [Sesbania bispinosa]
MSLKMQSLTLFSRNAPGAATQTRGVAALGHEELHLDEQLLHLDEEDELGATATGGMYLYSSPT